MNSISEPISNSLVKHSVRNAKFKSMCAICNKCLFDANHDMCLVDFVNDVNVCSKSKSKRNEKSKAWKPTGKVFTDVGYKWKPTGRFFTIVGNSCPLTRITPKKIVHLKETTSKSAKTSKPEIKVYSKIPKQLKLVGFLDRPLCRLSHLNFGTINKLAKDGLVRGIPKLKFQKDHLCSACALGKSKKFSHQPKAEDTNQEKLYLLHMDLCGLMRVESINGKKYILAEAINTAYYTQNHSLIRLQYHKTPYEFMHEKPDLSFFQVFGSLFYPTNDNEDLGKLNAKADIGIFVGYASSKKAFRIYNRGTQKIIEIIHMTFDELTVMASKQFGSGLRLQVLTPATSSSGLVPNIIPQQPCNPPKRDGWHTLFQPLFDEYFNPPTIAVSTVPVAAAPRTVEIADSPVSTSIDHDAP
ncbi:retrovirus-related pol polyprotein from transposon TNT 1-94 [Tanacetum coccineum]